MLAVRGGELTIRPMGSRLLSKTLGSFPRPCPHCGEPVRIDAARCLHCHTALDRPPIEELFADAKRLREGAREAGQASWERRVTNAQRTTAKRLSKKNDLGLIRLLADGRLELTCTGRGRHRRYVIGQDGESLLIEERSVERRRYRLYQLGITVGLLLFFGSVVVSSVISFLVGVAILIVASILRPEPTDTVDDADTWERVGKGWESD